MKGYSPMRSKGWVLTSRDDTAKNMYLAYGDGTKLYNGNPCNGYFWADPVTFWKFACTNDICAELVFKSEKAANAFLSNIVASNMFGDAKNLVVQKAEMTTDFVRRYFDTADTNYAEAQKR